MKTLCDGTNYVSLSYSQGRVCPSPFCTYPPPCASASATISRWIKGKKHTCQESAKNFRVASRRCGHRVDFPQGQFDLSPHAAPSTSQQPPGLAHLPLRCHAGAAGAGRSAGAGGSASVHQSRPHWWSWDGPRAGLVRGQRQSQSVSRVPEVSRAVVEDLGRMGQDGGATGTLPHRLSHYSGE